MSTTNKTVLGIVIVAVIALIVAFALRSQGTNQAPAAANGNGDSLPTAATDTSDSALQQDSAAIDAQLAGLDNDTATVDQGMSEIQ